MTPRTESTARPIAETPTPFGKYELVRRLGRGGMAEVWLARIVGPAGFSRQLVVKRILRHLLEEEQFLTMFVDEARLLARINHPNIVQVYELGDVDGEYFLAMEYVAGEEVSRGVTPLVLVLEREAEGTTLRLRAPGFAPYVARVVGDENSTVEATLVPLPTPDTTSRHRHAHQHGSPSQGGAGAARHPRHR